MPTTEQQPHDNSLSKPVPDNIELVIDERRAMAMQHHMLPETGIFVRAQHPKGGMYSADISTLTKDSLLLWLGTQEGLADRVVVAFLGHSR